MLLAYKYSSQKNMMEAEENISPEGIHPVSIASSHAVASSLLRPAL